LEKNDSMGQAGFTFSRSSGVVSDPEGKSNAKGFLRIGAKQ
jgi:hypothetical protein